MTTRRGFLGAALGLSTLAVPRRVLAHAIEPPQVSVSDGSETAPLNEPYGAYLNYNEFPEGPCPAAQAAIAAASPHAGHYCPGTVALLQHTLAETLQVPEAWLLLHPGSGPLLMLAAQVFTNPHRPLTTAALGYEKCSNGARTVNAPVNPVPLLSDGAHDLDRMRAAPSGLIYVCNPNNPTGTITPHDRLVAFLARVPSDTIVIIDEAYIHFSDQPSMVPLVDRYPNLLVTRTFSKAYGTGSSSMALPARLPRSTSS